MLPEVKRDTLNRLSYIEGHIAGVKRMVADDRYCVDVLKQTHAIRHSIEKLETKILEAHLHTCVVEGVKGGREEQVLQELVDIYSMAEK